MSMFWIISCAGQFPSYVSGEMLYFRRVRTGMKREKVPLNQDGVWLDSASLPSKSPPSAASVVRICEVCLP